MSPITTLSLLPIEALAGLVRDGLGRRQRDDADGTPAEFRRSEAFAEDLDGAARPVPGRGPSPHAPLAGYVGVVVLALASTAGLLLAGGALGV